MMMVLFTTAVPHHHHQTMICLVKEVCELDGCCDDEHTSHSDANHEEDESHCTAHEKYCPSEDLRLDSIHVAAIITETEPVPQVILTDGHAGSRHEVAAYHSPPILSWQRRC